METSERIKSIMVLALLATTSTACAQTIIATASGDQYPNILTAPGSIANGDLFITGKDTTMN